MDSEYLSSIKRLKKILKETPKITNKEISEHISRYMSHKDVNWLVMGSRYQAKSSICPFCGQRIANKEYQRMIAQLNKFIKGRQKQKADKIAQSLNQILPFFNVAKLNDIFNALRLIKEENSNYHLLHKSTERLLTDLQLDSSITTENYSAVEAKITTKIANPYENLELSADEEKVWGAVSRTLGKMSKLLKALEREVELLQAKIQKTSEYTKSKSLYEASFGEAHESIAELISTAKAIVEIGESIGKCQHDIDNLFETKKLDTINDFLGELNVNFRVVLKDRKYCVQIIGYEAAEYSKENKILCSEGERRMLALAYFLQDIAANPEKKVIVVDDPISSLDLNRKSVVAFKIVELMSNYDDQIIILSHDISFIEKITSIVPAKMDLGLLELSKNKTTPFRELHLEDYLVTDEEVYKRIIEFSENSSELNMKIVGLMALRPYFFIKTGMNPCNKNYLDIERRSTHLAHSIYSRSSRVPYRAGKYNKRSLRAYCKKVSKLTKLQINPEKLVPDNWDFSGFSYEKAWSLYSSIPTDTISDLRIKALLFRLVLETSLYMLVNKKTFNPERIGTEYNKAIKGTTGEKKNMCVELDRLYDLSKKYHHGTEGGSTLGLAALNPDEMIYFDARVTAIHDWIVKNKALCNPNSVA